MLSHGLVSGALFLCVGVLYDRLHTHEIARFGGLVERMPAYAFVFMVFTLAAIGLPGTSGFVGEFLILLGTFRVSTLECFLAATALFLGPAYMLYLYRRVIFGTLTRADLRGMLDLSTAREGGLCAAAPLGAVDGDLSQLRSCARSRHRSITSSNRSRPPPRPPACATRPCPRKARMAHFALSRHLARRCRRSSSPCWRWRC